MSAVATQAKNKMSAVAKQAKKTKMSAVATQAKKQKCRLLPRRRKNSAEKGETVT
jgi:hypothetical protein